jgi:hypothetical protein
MPERRTEGNEFGLLPTPRVMPGTRSVVNGKVYETSLQSMAMRGMLPTPNVPNGGRIRRSQPEGSKRQMSLETVVLMLPTPDEVVTNPTGAAGPMRLNPLFVAWMMGYPPGWLDVECRPSRRSATP